VIVVPQQRAVVGHAGIVAGASVRSRHWRDAATQAAYLLGIGRQIVPATSSGPLSLSTLSAHKLGYYLAPTPAAIDRRWGVRAKSGTMTIKAGSGGPSVTFSPGPLYAERGVIEELSASASAGAFDLVITPSAATTLAGISCVEVPRVGLAADSTDLGTDLSKLAAGQPILASDVANLLSSLGGGIARVGARTLVQWAVPYSVGGATSTAFASSTTTSASWVSVFPGGDVPGLGGVLSRSATTRGVTCYFLAWVTSGTGLVRLSATGSGGTSSTANVTSTSPAWVSVTLDIDAENMTVTDGRRGGHWEMLQPEFNAPPGQIIYCASVSCFETA